MIAGRTHRCAASLLTALLLLAELSGAAPLVVETEPLTPEQQRAMFHLPPGFEIQLVASNPDIGQPMNLSFDAAGRLWVTNSVEYPYPVDGEGVQPRPEKFKNPPRAAGPPQDKVTVISGISPEGRPASIRHFATGLNIPIGVLPLHASSSDERGTSAIIFSIPNLYRLTDTDGDGVADKREVLYGPFGNIDTHGMVNSLIRHSDGWIYANHGFSNTSTVKGTDGQEITLHSGNTFRFRADGSHIESYTHGQVNPFGMSVDRWGNLYNADCHSMPLTCLIPGACYESFGKPHDGLGFGPTMIDHGHGSTGICGVAWYEAEHFPKPYRDCIYLCNPVNGIVHRDRIQFHGSSPWVETQPEFITCDDGWFRPVDVKLGPDGALYIADFYNAIIGHYEVPLEHPRRDRIRGRIWRVVYTGTAESESAAPLVPSLQTDLSQLSDHDLLERLGDPNMITRQLAGNLLSDRTPEEEIVSRTAALVADPQAFPAARVAAMSVLCRWQRFDATGVPDLFRQGPPLFTGPAISLLSAYGFGKNPVVRGAFTAALQGESPEVQRIASSAFAGDPQPADVPGFCEYLLTAETAGDSHLRHQNIITLRNLLNTLTPPLNNTTATYANPITAEEVVWNRVLEIEDNHPELFLPVVLGLNNRIISHVGVSLLSKQDVTIPVDVRSQLITRIAGNSKHYALSHLERACRNGNTPLEQQMADLTAALAGANERDRAEIRLNWGRSVASKLLLASGPASLGWIPLDSAARPNQGKTFQFEARVSADGDNGSLFHSSLPAGETNMGTLRSDTFIIPDKLSFYLAGHNGFPDQPLKRSSYVRLYGVEHHTVLSEAFPPRNDVAQLVEWDLSAHTGRLGYLEITDGDADTAYAWLAAGRFSLNDLNNAAESPFTQGLRMISAWGINDFNDKVWEIFADLNQPLSVRIAAVDAVVGADPQAVLVTLRASAERGSPQEMMQCLNAILHSEQRSEVLGIVMQKADRAEQARLAQLLATDAQGCLTLLELVRAGRASALLLTQAAILEKIRGQNLDGAEQMIIELTSNLPPVSEQIEELIRSRRNYVLSNFHEAEAPQGQEVFKKNCSACHQYRGEGNKVGPQLEGIGNRGVERLLEDILDPNRNVDAAFRTSVIALTSGKVLTGLKRRDEGSTLVYADNQGKEFTVIASEIDELKESPLSLMPANVGEKLTEAELVSLLKYLLPTQN